MKTVGVDLAAQPAGTALAVVDWREGTATLDKIMIGVDDVAIVNAASDADKLGIDCALGWPREFVDFLVKHSLALNSAHQADGGLDWRRRLSFRETDRQVRAVTGRWPLSVATDRLGVTALRAAGLLSRLSTAGLDVDRSGGGSIVEVYPGASLRLWGFDTAGYKTARDARNALLESLQEQAPWLILDRWVTELTESADAFDALIAALAARSAALGLSTEPDEQLREQARVEGWIALPTTALAKLVAAPDRMHS